jgi:hypothetical protein
VGFVIGKLAWGAGTHAFSELQVSLPILNLLNSPFLSSSEAGTMDHYLA